MVITVLAAFLASAAFAPIGIWYFAVFGYAILLRKITKTDRPIWHLFLFGLFYNATVLYWSGKFVGALPWLLLSLLQALFYIPVGYIAKKFKNNWWTILALLTMEELRANFPFGGFGWTRIAFSQVESPALRIVPYGGVLALSAITLIFAILLTKISFRNLILSAFIFIGLALLPLNAQGSGAIKLLAIQGNTPSVGLDFNSRAKAVFDLHRDATYRFANEGYDAIVWPENAIDIDPNQYPEVAKDISALTSKLDTPLVAGVVLDRFGAPANASVMYDRTGAEKSIYVKRGLTPFGEFMPLRALAEIISPYAKSVTDFKPGSDLQTHNIAGYEIGPIICYEIINDNLVHQMAANSSGLIVQTNSATFADTSESRQQLAITRIRAVETSRNILSVSTIGISAFIDNNGRVVNQSKEGAQAALVGNLQLNRRLTSAVRFGYLINIFILLFIALVASRSFRRRYT